MTGKKNDGPERGSDTLVPLVYAELRNLADRLLKRERPDHTLQPTAIVHEAYLRLADHRDVKWTDRSHFMAVASRAIRRILIDHARSHRTFKRGGKRLKVTLDSPLIFTAERDVDVVHVDEALKKLANQDERQSRVVELRFFGGLTVSEAAQVLGVSKRTVESDWTLAKAWLHRELSED